MEKERVITPARAVIFLLVVGLSIYLILIRDRIQELEVYGYPGIFLISLVSNATVIIPMPGVVVTSAMGAVFNPFWVALASGTGAAIGEISGYLAGFSGRGVIQRTPQHDRLQEWMGKYGGLTVLVLALIPNPLFDVAGITAGALKMPLPRFLLYCSIGKFLKMLVFAYGGARLLNWLFP